MKGVGASSRIFELLDARPLAVQLGVGKPLPVTTPPRRLIFDNVRFAYPSRPNTEILKGVNLTIEPGKSPRPLYKSASTIFLTLFVPQVRSCLSREARDLVNQPLRTF